MNTANHHKLRTRNKVRNFIETTNNDVNFRKVRTFSRSLRGKTRYELWRFEIQFVLNGKVYIHYQRQVVRRSLKGDQPKAS